MSGFGFGGRLTQHFPSQVIIDITEVCNLACIHCPHPAFKVSEHYAARYLPAELNVKAVAEVKKHGAQFIRYCAEGEPLIHPECYEFIQHAVENSGTFVTLTTNGTLLNEKKMRRLLDSGLHMIDVSIDAASAAVYSEIRGGDYDAVVSNVKQLAAMRGNCKLVVSFIEQEKNKDEVEDFRWQWQGVADEIVIRRLHTAAGSVGDDGQTHGAHEEEVGARGGDDRADTGGVGRYPCVYPWERIVLNPAGKLKFCPQEWFGKAEIADYRDVTIHQVWNSGAYDLLRDAHVKNECFGVCKTCPDWKQTRWPGQGESYADLVKAVAVKDVICDIGWSDPQQFGMRV